MFTLFSAKKLNTYYPSISSQTHYGIIPILQLEVYTTSRLATLQSNKTDFAPQQSNLWMCICLFWTQNGDKLKCSTDRFSLVPLLGHNDVFFTHPTSSNRCSHISKHYIRNAQHQHECKTMRKYSAWLNHIYVLVPH